MRCGRCGNENAEDNRFCGMCGAPLTAKTQPVPPVRQAPSGPPANVPTQRLNLASGTTVREQPTQATPATQQGTSTRSMVPGQGPMTQAALSSSAVRERGTGLASPPMEVRPQPRFDDDATTTPTISGPSFLGLNQPGPRRTAARDENPGGDGNLQTSGSLDYLLEDDEEDPKRGWGKLVFALVALALAGGFGYLHWKQGGFDWLTAGSNKPVPTQSAPDVTQKPADNGGTAGSNAAAGTASNSGATAVVPSGTAAPNATPAVPPGTPVASSGNAGAPPTASGAESAPGSPSPAPVPPPPAPTGTASPNSSPSIGSPQDPAQGNTAPNTSAISGQASNSQTNSVEAITPAGTASPDAEGATQSSAGELQPQAATLSRKPTLKPATPKLSPVKPVDSVTNAQRYIYGRGVRQDCDRGLHMLKSAADRSDAKAMISLGALYSTGATCTPRDLPTAYRYFAMGLHKEPDNQALQDDLQKLWTQMTQPERQLAIKLSQ